MRKFTQTYRMGDVSEYVQPNVRLETGVLMNILSLILDSRTFFEHPEPYLRLEAFKNMTQSDLIPTA